MCACKRQTKGDSDRQRETAIGNELKRREREKKRENYKDKKREENALLIQNICVC